MIFIFVFFMYALGDWLSLWGMSPVAVWALVLFIAFELFVEITGILAISNMVDEVKKTWLDD